jgi:hypothetical protein
LRLSPEQIEALAQLRRKREEAFELGEDLSPDKFREKSDELHQQEQALAELLTPEQRSRLKQILLQQRGPSALADPDVIAALELSLEQQQRIRQLQNDAERFVRTSFEPGRRLRSEEYEQVKEAWSKTWENMLGVLTDEQMTRWKELTGEKFAGRLPPPPHGGPRRPPPLPPPDREGD